MTAVSLPGGRTAWTRPFNRTTSLAFGPAVVVLADADTQQLTVVGGGGTVLATVSTDATVLGYADDGLVLGSGRQVGLVTYSTSTHA